MVTSWVGFDDNSPLSVPRLQVHTSPTSKPLMSKKVTPSSHEPAVKAVPPLI